MDTLDNWLDFRRGENLRSIKLTCCDCGRLAQGNVSCDDGEICDDCHAAGMTESDVDQ